MSKGNLEYYEHYWYSARDLGPEGARQRMRQIRASVSGTWGSAGDPLGAQTPAAQNTVLEHFARMCAGRIDDWESLIDPTITYGENKSRLLANGAEKTAQDRKHARADWNVSADERARRHARKSLTDAFDAIDAGERSQLVDDVSAEFGADFVADVMERERIERSSTGGAPEPTIKTTPDPEPEPTPDPEPAPEPESVDVSTPEPEPDPTPEPVAPVESTTEPTTEPTIEAEPEPAPTSTKYAGAFAPIWLLVEWFLMQIHPSLVGYDRRNTDEYTGVTGTFQLAIDYLFAAVHSAPAMDVDESTTTENTQTTLEAY